MIKLNLLFETGLLDVKLSKLILKTYLFQVNCKLQSEPIINGKEQKVSDMVDVLIINIS